MNAKENIYNLENTKYKKIFLDVFVKVDYSTSRMKSRC